MNMMYAIENLERFLNEINLKRAKQGDKPIKPKKWSAFIQDTSQSWFDANLPAGKSKAVVGMSNQTKLLELYAAVNGCLKSYDLKLISETALVEIL